VSDLPSRRFHDLTVGTQKTQKPQSNACSRAGAADDPGKHTPSTGADDIADSHADNAMDESFAVNNSESDFMESVSCKLETGIPMQRFTMFTQRLGPVSPVFSHLSRYTYSSAFGPRVVTNFTLKARH
jgi:hypothetical protein